MAAGQHENTDNLTASNSFILPDDSDHSMLQQPLNVGVKNVKQILKCIQNGSPEIKDLILNECNIIYECKLCLNLFRSLANFLYHKRVYCKNHLCEDMLLFETLGNPENTDVDDKAFSAMKHQLKKNKNDTELSLTETNISPAIHAETIFSQNPSEMSFENDDFVSQKCLLKKSQSPSIDDDFCSSKNDIQKDCISHKAEEHKLGEVDIEIVEKEKKSPAKLETSDSLQMPCTVSATSSLVVRVKQNTSKRVSKNIFVRNKKKMGYILESQSYSRDICMSETKNGKKSNIISIALGKIHENPNAVLQRTFSDASNIVSKEGPDINLIQHDRDVQEKFNELEQRNTNDKSYNEVPSTTLQNKLSQKKIYMTRKRRLLGRNDCDLTRLMCCICKLNFTTLKMLYVHMMSSHSQARLYYPCPFCKTLFVQMYGVTRHLVQIHGKKREQVNNKLKEMIRKKAVWKYVNDDEITIEEIECDESDKNYKHKSDAKIINSGESNGDEKLFHSYMKVERSTMLHHCSKCNRVFSRKSSQVSHEKFCIMNSEKKEILSSELSSISLSKSHVSNDIKVNTRPKRAAEKQMHKDFVNSQTLKWRSANKIETGGRTSSFKWSRTHERKIMSIVNVTKLLCLKCDKKFSSFSNLRRHAAIHIGWTRYKCTFCNSYKSYNRSDCKQHVQRTHFVSEEDVDQYVKSLFSEVKSGETSGIDKTKSENNCLTYKNKTQNKLENSCKNTNIAPAKSLFSSDLTQFKTIENDCSEKKNSEKKKPSRRKTKKMSLKSKSSTLFRTKSSSMNERKSILERKQSGKKKNVECKKQNMCDRRDGEIFPCVDKLQMTYKSSTTNSPTTIILSKTCASSTVQIMKNHAPVSFYNSLNSDKIKTITGRPLQQIKADESISSLCYNKTKPIAKTISCKNNKANYEDDESNSKISDAYPNVAKTLKRGKHINDWLTQNPRQIAAASITPRRDTAPLIIGLVPANSSTSSSMTS